MLTQDQLVQLHHSVGERRVLSVYIDTQEADPAETREWRVRFRHMVDALPEEHDPEQLTSIDEALARIEEELGAYPGQLPGAGWVGFATPDRVLYAGPAPSPVPDLLRWDDGIYIARCCRPTAARPCAIDPSLPGA